MEIPLEENINRRVLEEGSVEARTIEDAIAVLRYVAIPQQHSPLKVSLSLREILAGRHSLPQNWLPFTLWLGLSNLDSKNRTRPLPCCSVESV